MFDEDTEGLELLLKQHRQRSPLLPLLSLEPVQDGQSPKMRRKQRKQLQQQQKQQQQQQPELYDQGACDGVHPSEGACGSDELGATGVQVVGCLDSNGDSSDYATAEESPWEEEDGCMGNNSCPAVGSSQNVEEDSLDLRVSSPETTRGRRLWEEMAKEGVCNDQGKQRAPNKRQKRRRREMKKLAAELAVAEVFQPPFSSSTTLDPGLSDLGQPGGVVTSRGIPSLLQLCLQAMDRGRCSARTHSQGQLPGGARRAMQVWLEAKKFWAQQKSHLLRMLHNAESKWDKTLAHNLDPLLEECLPLRRVWQGNEANCSADAYRGWERGDGFRGLQLLLQPFSFWQMLSYWHFRIDVTVLIPVLAAAAAMMLPQALPDGQLNIATDDGLDLEGRLGISMESAMLHCKQHLAERFPKVVENLWNLAEPYIYWSRGNITQAIKSFLKLSSQQSICVRTRALFLTEAARAAWMVEDKHMASMLLRQAEDVALSKLTLDSMLYPHFRSQTAILLASLEDIGVQTKASGKMALALWQAALQACSQEEEKTVLAALDSLLCFHSGAFTGPEWQQHLGMVTELVNQSRMHVQGPLAFLYAVRGIKLSADHLYQAFLVSVDDNSGGQRLQPLLEVVMGGPPPDPLQVVWRVQLGHRFMEHTWYSTEADLCARDLHLELTEEGNLTADIQMALPPIRALNLDPYTGKHIFHQTPGVTQPWHGFLKSSNCTIEQLLTPTPVLLYQDERAKVAVSLVTARAEPKDVQSLRSLTLIWQPASGRPTRLNVAQRVKEAQYEETAQSVTGKTNPRWKHVKSGNEEHMQLSERRAKWIVDYLFKTDRAFDMNDYDVRRTLQEDHKTPKDEKSLRKNFQKWHNIPPFSLQLLDYRVFGHTIFLLVSSNSSPSSYTLFVDCSSQEAFLSPKVSMETKVSSWVLRFDSRNAIPTMPWHHKPRDRLLRRDISTSRSARAYGVFNAEGELVLKSSEDVVIVDSTIFRSKSPLRIQAYRSGEWTGVSELPGIVEDLHQMGTKLLAVMDVGLVIIHPQSLHPLPISIGPECFPMALGPGSKYLEGSYSHVAVLAEKVLPPVLDSPPSLRVAVVADQHLLLFEMDDLDRRRSELGGEPVNTSRCELVMALQVPGHVREVYLGERPVGLLVTISLVKNYVANNREYLLRYSYLDGKLTHVLPMLGPGPRSFFTVWLPGNKHGGKEGWYLYMRDGHGGLIAVCFGPDV